ncbi:CBS domain-containing protein [Pseudalkalibacillus berkeleyi]|uniref:CBS domain-containing protein n=1 Tax=Pseudalkalibacillus berkeleyi TaxID=1069813 RepID=A0ABS9GVY3_9BACL|nr:CBS domain-containing protein [Pseudalkalibacillus berkeleyi]MCF6136978.1 CBS domain-containing protein [Pseudalkalibacillus berkeleyi]
MKQLSEIMTTKVDYCTTLDNVYEAAVKMKNDHVGAIPVCENEKLVGMITDRDIVIRGVAEKRPNASKITDVMSDQIITGTPDMSIEEAMQLMMEHDIRRLPVVEQSQLVGIVSLGDLATHQESNQQAGIALSDISSAEPDQHSHH